MQPTHSLHEDDKAFPPKSAGRHMISAVPVAAAGDRAGDAQDDLLARIQQHESVNYLYVVDADRRLVGALSIRELFRAPKDSSLGDVMIRDVVSVRPHTHQEQAALLALHNNLKAVPVVDKNGAFLGVVPSGEILAILDSEHLEDALLSAGFAASSDSARSLIDASAMTYFRRRFPWLVIGLGFGMLTAVIVKSFEKSLEAEIALASFIPIVAYITDAVGTQTETLFIRTVGLERKIDFRKYLSREFLVTIFLAVSLAVLISLIGLAWTGSIRIAAILLVSILCGIIASSMSAIGIPWLITRLHRDPAVVSSPFATIVSDISSTLIYLAVATAALSWFGA